jgi:hypothetical protein
VKTLNPRYALLMMVLFAATTFAQESGPAEPDETEIVIPDLVLVVPELGVEEVTAVLPGESELALGQISLPLPGADELTVSDITFTAPLPAVSARTDGPAVFSTGRLGAGTSNRVIGELSIYKLGADPRFRLGFTHEGIDGFQDNPAGSGYYAFTNTIDAWLSMGNERLMLEAEGNFAEREAGLQGSPDFNAVSTRTTAATAELVYLPDPLIELSGVIDAGFATRRQTVTGAATVPTDQELLLEPAVSARFSIRSVELFLNSSYYLRTLAGSGASQQDLDFIAGIEVNLPWAMVIEGHAGVFWDFPGALRYPLGLSLESLIGDAFELRAAGGFRVDRTNLASLWEDEPVLATVDSVSGVLSNNEVLYASADARWTGASGLALQGSVAFTSESGTVDLQAFDETEDEFPFVQSAFMTLKPTLAAAWQPSPVWQFEVGWNGHFLDRPTVQPLNVLDAAVRFSEGTGRFGADLETFIELHPEPEVPVVNLSGSFAASEGVEFVLELSDILAPLMVDGRPVYGPTYSAAYPFIEPGFVATIFTRITL